MINLIIFSNEVLGIGEGKKIYRKIIQICERRI